MTTTHRLSRRAFTAGLGAAGLAATGLSTVLAPGSAAAETGPWADRARAGYRALRENLYLPDTGLYREGLEGFENPYSFVWPLREAVAACQHLSLVPGEPAVPDAEVAAHLEAFELYLEASSGSYASYPVAPLGAGGDAFYDDNTVIGLEQVRRFRLSGDPVALDRAVRAFDFVVQSWDERSTGASAGGMHWVDADWNPYQGGTNVTSLAAELAAHLYEQTGRQSYLDWAVRCYDWVRRTMRRDPGLYANGLLLDGTVEETLWTYNTGSMVGAATLLHRATGQRQWLRRAQLDAEAGLAYWSGADRLYEQPAVFNAILMANLLLHASQRPGWAGEVIEVFSGYASRLWEENRDVATGLFTFQASGGGAPDPDQTPQTLHQAAVVQLCSLLAWDPADHRQAA